MCYKFVLLFDCGHARKINIQSCNIGTITSRFCLDMERILLFREEVPEIDLPNDFASWRCVFRCIVGEANEDPLIEALKENLGTVRCVMERRAAVVSASSNLVRSLGENSSDKAEQITARSSDAERHSSTLSIEPSSSAESYNAPRQPRQVSNSVVKSSDAEATLMLLSARFEPESPSQGECHI